MNRPPLLPTTSPSPGTKQTATPRANPWRGSTENTAAFLQDLVLDSVDVDQFLNTLAGVAAEHLAHPGQEIYCGVTLLRPNHAKTLASNNHAALKLDKIQYTFGDGPCLTAARTHELVHVPDTQTDRRWPAYLQTIAEHGIRSTLGVPIPLAGEADCALNLYSTTINGFPTEAIASAQTFADEASRSLRLAVRIAHLSDKAENLSAAMESRTVIDLAAGIIMGQNKCGQAAAIAIMKTTASHREIKLRTVAAEIVAALSDETPATHFE
jgi:GAF domain-containing protein